MNTNLCIILVTSLTYNISQVDEVKNAKYFLDSQNIDYQEVDGSFEENLLIRNELFKISGKRGVYPQIFLVKNGEKMFIGEYKDLQELMENEKLDKEFLEQHPEIKTFTKVFEGIPRKQN